MAFEQFTTTIGNQRGCDQLNARFDSEIGHKHDGSEHNGPQIDSTGLADEAVSTPKVAPKAITADRLSDTAIQDKLGYTPVNPNELGNLSLPGISDYIARGRKITPGDGLQVSISSGVDYISGQTIEFTENTLDLPERSACLLYDKADGTSGYVAAVLPEVDNNTVGLWVFNQTGAGAPIPNLAEGISPVAGGGPMLPYGGIASVDGWSDYALKANGTNGYHETENSNNFPTGTATRGIIWFGRIDALQANSFIWSYGQVPTNGREFSLCFHANGELQLTISGSGISLGYVVKVANYYLIETYLDAGVLYLYVDGSLVYQGNHSINTTATTLSIGHRWHYSGQYGAITTCFVSMRNALRTPQQIARSANKLFIPNFYTNEDGNRKSIKELLPANAISIGFVRTNSSEVILKNDIDYKYGRHEGAVGGNRKVFLGWQAFSGGTVLDWDNPFGTRKTDAYYCFATDANGANESPIEPRFISGSSDYGVEVFPSSSNALRCRTRPNGVVCLNDIWQTSGYIGCYAEVLEDD